MAKKQSIPPVSKSPIWLGDGNEKRLVGWFLTLFITGMLVLLLFSFFS